MPRRNSVTGLFVELNNLTTRLAVVPLLAFLLAACASMGPQDTDQYIFLNESETLFVKFTGSMPDLADNMARSRRDDFMQVMEELLYLYQLPIQVHVLREREEPGNGPLLTIFASRFNKDRMGDLVVTFNARLSRYGELNTLGSYSQRHTPPPIVMSNERLDEAFRDAIRKPLKEMFDDLQQHIPSPEEIEGINAPLNELGAE